MFDAFLRERAARTGERFRPFDTVTDYDEYVDGKPRADGVRSFLDLPRHRAAGGRTGRPTRAPRPCTGSATARTSSSCSRIRERRRRGLRRARSATCGRPRTPGCARAVVSSSANCRDVLRRGRHRGPVRRRGSTAWSPAERTCRASRARHVPGRRTRPRRRTRASPPSSRTPSAGVEAGRAGGFGFVVGVDRVGQAEALRAHGADVVVTDLAELLDRS